jgi:hypothetical protein
MAKIANYRMLFFAISIFAVASSPYLLSSAFAWTVSNESYSDAPVTDLTNPGAVCGDHPCALGETPQPPKAVQPVSGSV